MASLFDPDKRRILGHVQVNIPFSWLMDQEAAWLELFVKNRIQPEIGLDADALDRFGFGDFARVGRQFADAGCRITVHGPFLDLSPGSPDPRILSVTRHRLSRALAAADALSPETLVCHAGYDPARYDFIKEDWFTRAADTWSRLARSLSEKGVRLMLENVYETEPGQLARLLEKTQESRTGCCLDVGHLTVFSRVSLLEWIRQLAPYIGEIHLHDNMGQSDAHLGLGSGSIDFVPLFDWLENTRPMPVITLEPHQRQDLDDSLAFLKNRKWFQ